jgi:hypothetical protein
MRRLATIFLQNPGNNKMGGFVVKRAIFILVSICVLIAPVIARQPPFIDRELFLGNPEATNAPISPDGKYILFAHDKTGDANYDAFAADPAPVGMPQKIESSAGAPAVVAGFPPGQYKYKGTVKVGETSIDITVSTSIQEADDVWKIIEIVTLPSGDITETATFDKKALTILTRTIRQGPASINLAFKENKIKGKITINGQEKPIDSEVGGPLFADGAGAMFAIGALPLAEGYSVAIRGFDTDTMKADRMQLKVAGSEKVTVAAGSFDCYRVEISSTDGAIENYTVWIAKDSRKPVKFAAMLAQMGAKLAVEMQ